MSTLDDTLRRATRRHLTQRALARAGLGLAVAAAGGLVLLAVDRAWRLDLPWPVWMILAGLGVIGGVATALVRPPAATAVAARIDRRLRLEDRLATAAGLEGSSRRHDPAFAALVRRDADDLAGRLDVRSVVPVHLTAVWGWAAGLGLLLLLGGLLLPARAAPADADDAPADPAASPEMARAEVASSINDAVDEVLGKNDDAEPLLDDATRDQLESLRDLASQLAADPEQANPDDPPLDTETALERSAAELSAVADQLTEQADRDTRAAEELARRFSGLESAREEAGIETPLSTAELLETLQRGEFGDAADVLEELLEDGQTLSEADRAEAARQLRELGRQVESLADPVAAPDERQQQLVDTLREQGIDEEAIRELLEGTSPETPATEQASDPAEALRREDVDEEIARQLARELESVRRQSAVDDQVSRETEQIADALERAAETLDEPETTNDPTNDEPAASPPPSRPAPAPAAPPADDDDDRAADTPPATPDGTEQRETREEPGAREERRVREETGVREQTDSQEERGTREERAVPEDASREPEQRSATHAEPAGSPKPNEKPGTAPNETPADRKPTDPPPDSPTGSPPGSPPYTPTRTGVGEEPPTPTDGAPPPDAPRTGASQPDPDASPETPDTTRRTPPPGTPPTPEGQETPVAGEPSPDGTERTPAPGTPPPGADERSPTETLRDIERRRRSAEDQRRLAGRTREAARRLAENMSDDERRQWAEQWRNAGDPTGGSAGPTLPDPDPGSYTPEIGDTLSPEDDARGGRKIGEHLSGATADPSGLPDGRQPSAERVRAARRAAERAVNESAVPSRYHGFIRRYFDRLERTAKPTAPASPPPSPPPPGTPAPAASSGSNGDGEAR